MSRGQAAKSSPSCGAGARGDDRSVGGQPDAGQVGADRGRVGEGLQQITT